MNTVLRRGIRLALMTVGFAGLFVMVNAVPGAATLPNSGFHSDPLARGTYQSHGSLPLGQGLDIVVAKVTLKPGGSSGWHSHPGGAIVVVGCLPVAPSVECQSEITFYVSVGNHCDITKYTQGQSFIERPSEVVIAVNTGSTDTINYVTFPGVPVGGSTRIDRPNPGTCPGV